MKIDFRENVIDKSVFFEIFDFLFEFIFIFPIFSLKKFLWCSRMSIYLFYHICCPTLQVASRNSPWAVRGRGKRNPKIRKILKTHQIGIL